MPLLAAPLQGLLCQDLVSENFESNLPPDLTRGALLPVWGLQVNAVEDGLGAAGGGGRGRGFRMAPLCFSEATG